MRGAPKIAPPVVETVTIAVIDQTVREAARHPKECQPVRSIGAAINPDVSILNVDFPVPLNPTCLATSRRTARPDAPRKHARCRVIVEQLTKPLGCQHHISRLGLKVLATPAPDL
jgi:hypothetical protein